MKTKEVDFIDKAVCKNCKHFTEVKEEIKGVVKISYRCGATQRGGNIKPDHHCSIWELNPEINITEDNQKIEELKIVMNQAYENTIYILREYCDLREEYYSLAALWILGTYVHSSFNTYPYLFLNAMRGSGKTRLLKLISSLAHNGKMIGSPTEAILFRIPQNTTLCIDEFEGILRKGNEGVREMLNASYKRGMTVMRMKKVTTPEGSDMVAEEFEPYKPICLANIFGMEEVLGDRCITLILEKSTRKDIMLKMEVETTPMLKSMKSTLVENLVYLCSYCANKGYIEKWNNWVNLKYNTQHTHTTLTTLTTDTTPHEEELFERIENTGINGRNLELFMPLMLIADFIGKKPLKNIINIATKLNKEKKHEELTESKDVALFEYVSKQNPMDTNYLSIKLLTERFRAYMGDTSERDEVWLNDRWMGRALKRLALVVDKRRMAGGMEITLNIYKAREKMGHFNGEEELTEKQKILNMIKENRSLTAADVLTDKFDNAVKICEELKKDGLIFEHNGRWELV